MTKKNALTGKNNISADDYIRKRREILDLCYKRLQEMIPECTSEVNLLKCIEILEKHESRNDAGDERQALCAIADTLDRVAIDFIFIARNIVFRCAILRKIELSENIR